jgi:hypothetical protein
MSDPPSAKDTGMSGPATRYGCISRRWPGHGTGLVVRASISLDDYNDTQENVRNDTG